MLSIKSRWKELLHTKSCLIICCIVLSFIMVLLFSGATITKYVVTINDNDTRTIIFTSDSNPDEILEAQNIVLNEEDEYKFSGIEDGQATITIMRSKTVVINADGNTYTTYLTSGTVKDALNKLSITVNDDDKINASLESIVTGDMDITINRVTYNDVSTNEVIAFTNNYKRTPLLKDGKTKLLYNGSNGSRTITARQTLVDGVIVEENIISNVVTKEAVAATVLLGDSKAQVTRLTKPSSVKLDAKGNPVNYKKKIVGRATGYSSIGSPNKSRIAGQVAMDTRIYPKGTKLYIKTPDGSFVYGYAEVDDTGTALYQGIIDVDLFYDSYLESCLNGVKYVEIYFL